MTPYYDDGTCQIFHGDAIRLLLLDSPPEWEDAVVVTDPPYGIGYSSNQIRKAGNARGIVGDKTTMLRDLLLSWLGEDQAALIFGSPRIPKPQGIRGTLVWDKGGALGMGDLSLPWKLDHEEMYVLGQGWAGSRNEGSVLREPPVQSVGRQHPNQKPVTLLTRLLVKAPPGLVLDPFMGSGTTLVAAKQLGRRAVGIELDERYCEIAAERLAQEVLQLEVADA